MVSIDELKIQLKENLITDEKLEKEFYEIEREDIAQSEKDVKQFEVSVNQEVVKTKLDIIRAELKNALWAKMFPMKMPEVKKVPETKKAKEDE